MSVCLRFRVFCGDLVQCVAVGFLGFRISGISVSVSGEEFGSWVCVVLVLCIGEKEMWLLRKSSRLVG